jgi:hypothetical protein
MGRPAEELAGAIFGRLTVLHRGESRPQGGGKPRWVCQCECGNVTTIPAARLKGGSNKSCGCFRRDRAGGLYRTHGKSQTLQYTMFYDARKRAIALSLPFDIEPQDIEIPATCPVLGLALAQGGKRDDAASLDRFIPHLGYVKTNIRVISFRANRLKSDASIEEMRRVLAYMEGSC